MASRLVNDGQMGYPDVAQCSCDISSCPHFDIVTKRPSGKSAHLAASLHLPTHRYLQSLQEQQWIKCDVRTIDMTVLGKFGVIMADPPWQVCVRVLHASSCPMTAVVSIVQQIHSTLTTTHRWWNVFCLIPHPATAMNPWHSC
jgi:hypothetical protein